MSSETVAHGVLAELPLLSGLPDEVRELVVQAFEPVKFAFGETIFAQGDPADAYYVISAGTARMLETGDDGHEVSLSMLRPGDAFGEVALLERTPRKATVRASSALSVLRLDRALFRALVSVYPMLVGAFALEMRRQRLVNGFLRVRSVFAGLDRAATEDLVEVLEPVELSDGEEAVRQGGPGDALYLVEDGRLGVWVTDGAGASRRVRTMHTGEFFGELALFRAAPGAATVRAEGDVRLLRLPAADFHRLIAAHDGFARRVRERASLHDARDRDERHENMPEPAPPDVWVAADPGLAVTEDGSEDDIGEVSRLPRRFPLVRQIDQMDCGAACIAMVCRAFGHDVSMTTIRHEVGTATDGTTLRGLVRGGEEVGLRMRAIKSSPDRLDALPLPAVIHWKGNHWLILYRIDGDRLRIADPARGLRTVSRGELVEHWSGYAALAQPTERLAQAPGGGLDLRWLGPFVRPHRRILAACAVLSLVAAGLEMVLPVFSQLIIDRVVGHHDETLLYILSGAMLGVLVLAVGVTILQRYLLARIASRLDVETLDFVSWRLLRLPMRYFETRRTGDIERRLTGMSQVRVVLVQNGVVAIAAAAQLAVALAIMLSYSWTLGLLFLACAPAYLGLMRYSQQRLRPVFDSVEEGHGRYHSRQIDAIKGIETVKAMGAEEGLRRRMAVEFGLLRDKLYRADLVAMVYEGLVSIVSFAVYGLFLFFCALEVLHHQLSVGELVSFTGLVLLATAPLGVLLAMWDRLQLVTVLMGRLQDVLEQEPEQGHDHAHLRSVAALEGHIRLRRVGFAYATSPERPILKDISLDVPPGTTVALVGRSGSGKSTLVKCLAGLLVPTEGSVHYDGIDLRDLRLGDVRRSIGFVLQDPYLFDDTIEANIAFGETHHDLPSVRRAAEIADAADFIERLPLGYQTRIGDSGLRLSGGQAQRVAIARALYRSPPVLIFDEATSALDAEAERVVKQNMDRLLEGRTAFVIAHRLSTIRDADIICVLEQGRLVEHGTHEELLRRRGLYAYLQAQQLED